MTTEEEFLKGEKNLFDIKKLSNGKYSISDFEFNLDLNNDGTVVFTSNEEFLEPIEKEMKNKRFTTTVQALEEVLNQYDRFIDDEKKILLFIKVKMFLN